jgi:glutamate-1-semialdehyde 2,1-aminomutase
VRPDLTALGKALGGGLPLGALVGRRELLSLVAPRAARGEGDAHPYVFHGGTYNGTPSALAAGLATLNILEEPGTLEAVNALAGALRQGIADLARRRGIALQAIGRGSIVDFYFTDAPIRSSREIWGSNLLERKALDYRLLARGIYNAPLHRYHVSIAHTEQDIERTLTLIEGSLTA